MTVIDLTLLGQKVEFRVADPAAAEALSAVYDPFASPPGSDADPTTTIRVSAVDGSPCWSVAHGSIVSECEDLSQLLYVVDKTLTVALQLRRPDLFFLHAAAVGTADGCILLIGESGAGKSTLCWAMCEAGFRYLSDELAPVNLDSMEVEPYPKAVSLKRLAEHSPALPNSAIDAVATIHVPANSLEGDVAGAPLPLGNLVFLSPQANAETPVLAEISCSEAAARLYANGLNQLAHEGDGLKAAASIAKAARSFVLQRAELPRMLAVLDVVADS